MLQQLELQRCQPMKCNTNFNQNLINKLRNFKLYYNFRASINKGIAIETLHYLNDGLFAMKAIK